MTCKVDMSGLCCGFSAATNATKSDFGEENKIGHDEEEPMSSANSNAPPFVDRFIVSPRAVHEFLRVTLVMRIVVEAEASYALNMNCAAPRGLCTTNDATQRDFAKAYALGCDYLL